MNAKCSRLSVRQDLSCSMVQASCGKPNMLVLGMPDDCHQPESTAAYHRADSMSPAQPLTCAPAATYAAMHGAYLSRTIRSQVSVAGKPPALCRGVKRSCTSTANRCAASSLPSAVASSPGGLALKRIDGNSCSMHNSRHVQVPLAWCASSCCSKTHAATRMHAEMQA